MTNYEPNTDGNDESEKRPTPDRSTAERLAVGYEQVVADGGFDAEFFEQVVEEIDVGVAVYDETGRFTYVNGAYAGLLDRDVDDLEGSAVWAIDPAVNEAQFDEYWESFEPGETRQKETVHERADGTEFPVETSTTAIEADERGYHVSTIAEVTECVEGWRELERQDERLEEFASVVSHDLRNPLNVAMGRLRLIKEECESEHLDPVENSLEQMEELIDDVLTLARDGSRVTETEPVSLRESVRTAWATAGDDSAALELDDDLATVQCIDTRLSEILENLFRNAVEHGGPDVTVSVGTFDDNSGFYVEDDGDGIDPEVRDEVFECGYSTTTRGTGFGLAIVEQITEAHGWNVELVDGADGGVRVEFHDVGIE